MAQLLDTSTNRVHPLRAHHTLGRSAQDVDTSIAWSTVSRIHAAMEWDGQQWRIRDLSRNGTWLDKIKLTARESVPLRAGQHLRFGSSDADHWELIDDSAPISLLIGGSADDELIALKPYLFLPNEESPTAVIFYCQRTERWLQQSIVASDAAAVDSDESDEEIPLQHGSLIQSGDKQWKLFLADSAAVTQVQTSVGERLQEFEFIFNLSLDEENTELSLKNKDRTVDLGDRAHHYLLAHLARHRAAEASSGLDQKNQGWVDNAQLIRDLGVDMPHINIMIFRARQQLAREIAESLESDVLVERRRGRIRFGCPRFSVYKGRELTCRLPLVDSA